MGIQFEPDQWLQTPVRPTVLADGLRRTRRMLGYPEWFFDGTNFSGSTANIPNMIALDDYLQIIGNLFTKVSDPTIHLDLPRNRGPAIFGNLALGMQHASTLADGLKLYAKYSNGAYPFVRYSWKVDSTGMWIQLDSLVKHDAIPYLLQNGMLNLVRYVRQFRASPPEACRVSLGIPPIYDPDLYPIGFQCPVQFNAAATAIFVPDKWITEKNMNYDETLWRIAISRIEEELRRFGQLETITNLSKLIDANRTDNGKPPRINLIAKILGISARTLNRQLASENTSFKNLVETVQKQRAEELIIYSHLSIDNISELLGFSDQSSFGRSFRRWFGLSPRRYRHKNAPASTT